MSLIYGFLLSTSKSEKICIFTRQDEARHLPSYDEAVERNSSSTLKFGLESAVAQAMSAALRRSAGATRTPLRLYVRGCWHHLRSVSHVSN